MTIYSYYAWESDAVFYEKLARIEAAEPAPESYVRQHRSDDDCWCEPYAVGTLGVMTHRVVEP